jgi:hypothetical protein
MPSPPSSSSSCSATHCVQVDAGRLLAWATHKKGGNRFGQLGQGWTWAADSATIIVD